MLLVSAGRRYIIIYTYIIIYYTLAIPLHNTFCSCTQVNFAIQHAGSIHLSHGYCTQHHKIIIQHPLQHACSESLGPYLIICRSQLHTPHNADACTVIAMNNLLQDDTHIINKPVQGTATFQLSKTSVRRVVKFSRLVCVLCRKHLLHLSNGLPWI